MHMPEPDQSIPARRDRIVAAAMIRPLPRHDGEAAAAQGAGCAAAPPHRMGKSGDSEEKAAKIFRIRLTEDARAPLEAVIVNAAGCGAAVADHGRAPRRTGLAEDAAGISALTRDVSRALTGPKLKTRAPRKLKIACRAARPRQDGKKVAKDPKGLPRRAGFAAAEPVDSHLRRGSAGSCDMLQPTPSARPGRRKLSALSKTGAEAIATGKIARMAQPADGSPFPILHIIELLHWASDGPPPEQLNN